VRGGTRPPGQGLLSLRLRDVDLADVFSILHGLTSQAFLVDGDVVGRVSVELNRVTLEDALAAIARGTDVRVSEPALVRRVSLAKNARPPVAAKRGGAKEKPSPAPSPAPPEVGGAPATFTVKRADVRDVLAAMTEADPSLASLGPPGFLGRVSLWATSIPLEVLRREVLAAADLTERIEEDRRVLRKPGGAEEALAPVAGVPPEPQLILRAQDLTIQELELAGLASAGNDWVAYAYSPMGALQTYASGARLWDGTVKEVQSTDVTLETEEGLLSLSLGPLP